MFSAGALRESQGPVQTALRLLQTAPELVQAAPGAIQDTKLEKNAETATRTMNSRAAVETATQS